MAKISFCAHGCKVNQYEIEKAKEQARAAGHQVVEFGQPADIQVVHTCSVTKAAVRDGRQALRRASRSYPSSKVIASGCAARTDSAELLPANQQISLVEELEKVLDDVSPSELPPSQTIDSEVFSQSRIRALLKIHDGCYFRCSFCIIPNARPVEASKPVEEVIREARRYVASGHKEVVITGVRITGYRPEIYRRRGLIEVIKRLGEIKGLHRVRLTSLYPSEVKNDLLTAIKNSPNACKHLHLALQSGDDGILAQMKRHYTASVFEEVVANAKALMPDVAITTDVIAGFPGETDEAFENTVGVMERVGFSKAHIFTYSPRPGTEAAQMPGAVPSSVAKQRTRRLIDIAERTGRQYREPMVGTIQQVIVEQEKSPGIYSGLTSSYVEVFFENHDSSIKGNLANVLIKSVIKDGLIGRLDNLVE